MVFGLRNTGGAISTNLILTPNQCAFPTGTALLPSATFINDTTSGLYLISASNIGVAVGGVNLATWRAGGLTVAGGTLTTSAPVFSGTQTWNAGGVTFSGAFVNITDTASAAGSMLLDVQKNSLSIFHVDNGGNNRFVRQDQTNSAVSLFLRKRGDSTSATNAIASAGGLGTIFFSGWNGAANVQSASVRGVAEELFTGSVNGTKLDLFFTPIGSNTSIVGLSVGDAGVTISRAVNFAYVAKTGTYTATAADYFINCTANTFTVNLPTAVGIAGRTYVLKNSGAGVITADPSGSQTIDGSTTLPIAAAGVLRIASDGANWFSF
jgi:hypothetical protein